jgi:shikimate dehydrogenase
MPDFVPRRQPAMYFIGVTTAKSSIMRVFPLWMKELGRPDVVIEGVDLKLHDEPENYRRPVRRIKADPLSLGALVTTHKITLLNAARDLFDYLDPYARICSEVSSISKAEGRIEGHAKDPITSGLCLDALLGPAYFGRTGGDVLCFGAGGSATAILLHLARKSLPADRPRRFVVVNRSEPRLAALRSMAAEIGTGISIECHCHTDPGKNDALLATMPGGSLIINATGMGKDLPGSPISNAATFPQQAVAWELNYRGELDFLHQALAQKEGRDLTVEDGWLYFLHGWTQVIAQVLRVDVGGAVFDRLSSIAAEICTPALPPRRYAPAETGARP